MQIRAEALIVAVRAHGEHGAVVRAMTETHGLLAGYVRGGRSKAMRPVFIPGNRVIAQWRSRSETQLAAMTAEIVSSRAPLMNEPLAALAVQWVTAVTAAALPEGELHPRIYEALDGALAAIENAPSARLWVPGLAQFEAVLLDDLGYGTVRAFGQLRSDDAHLSADVLTGYRASVLDARSRLITSLRAADAL